MSIQHVVVYLHIVGVFHSLIWSKPHQGFGLHVLGLFKGIKATNERQGNGTGILHQVAQYPIDLVHLSTRHPYPSLPAKT